MGSDPGVKNVITIRRSSFAEIKHFASRASQERVSITDTKDTVWHAVLDESGKIIACGAVMFVRQTARLKAYYVVPEARGLGAGNMLVNEGIKEASDDPRVNLIEVFSVNPTFFVARGFLRGHDIRNGITKLTKMI
jgi:N-acetylglutamate synthase-like GNAT family acetyltransferase